MSTTDCSGPSLEDAIVVIPCYVCGDPIAGDKGGRLCPGCRVRQHTAHVRNREARVRANGGTHTAKDIQIQYDLQEGECFYCGKTLGDRYHVDHVMPVSLGGSNGPENLVIACPRCNIRKGAKHPDELPALAIFALPV
jgi:5-methylcytosine-specific restriction endonuclease McrA